MLYHHPDLPVTKATDAAGKEVIVLGHAFGLETRGFTGGGRYAVVDWPYILTDAAALLSVHFGGSGEARAISSSPSLAACAMAGGPVEPDRKERLAHRDRINYIPAPGSPYRGLRKLLHDQKLHIPTLAVEHRPSPVRPLASYEEAVATLADELVGFAEELRARIPGTVYIPMTAGLDSRTIAAAFVAAGLPFAAVTLDFCGKPRTDITVGRAISRKLKFPHRTIELDGFDRAAADRLWRHTSGAVLDWDNTHIYPGNGYAYAGRGDAIVVGGCFEVGRQRAAEGCFLGLDAERATGECVWLRRNGTPGTPDFYGLLDEWLDWRRRHPLAMDFSASFYLDQRLSGWRAAVEHGLDLLPAVTLNPANNARLLSAMITPSLADQHAGRLQHEVIRKLAPKIADFPVNPLPLERRMLWVKRGLKRHAVARMPGLLRMLHRVRPPRAWADSPDRQPPLISTAPAE